MKIYIKLILIIGLLFTFSSCTPDVSLTISFNSNGGSFVAGINYDGKQITIPEDPTKVGYDFDGWYFDDVTFERPFSHAALLEESLEDNLIVHAKWNINQYTISFESNLGSSVISINQDYQSVVFEPDEPTREGYTFVGWYTDALFTTPHVFSTMPAEDITLYAKWVSSTSVPIIYTITWKNEDGSILETDEVEEGLLPTYDGNVPTKDSTDTYTYTFTGFSPVIDIVTGNQIYTATFEANLINLVTDFDPSELNDIFGFDIYSTLPSFTTFDYIVLDYSDSTIYEVYVDIFDWSEQDANQYIDLLDLELAYDTIEDSWILGDYYLYVYEDDFTYEGLIVYGFGIYGEAETIIENPDVDFRALDTLSTRQSINQFEVSEFSQSGLPSVGTYHVLVIPIEINGYPFPSDYQTNLNLVFNGNSTTTGWESVASYYSESSFGLLNLTFDISNKYTTANTKNYYQNQGGDGDQFAITEALMALNSQIDFSQYDSNNDGLIDSIIFIYSIDYNYDIDPWWAWVYAAQFGEASSITTLDGKAFEYYMWASYAFMEDSLPGMSGLVVNAETYIHELGHLMGFVDLYAQDYDYGPLGGFDMMDYNVGDHGPFNKLVFGWLQPLIAVEGSYKVTIDAYSTDTDGLSSAILIPYNVNDFNDGNAFDEYLLIMFYTPNGLYDGHLDTGYEPEQAGIVIYHIDARLYEPAEFWDEYFMYNNDGLSDFIVEILEADFNQSIPGNAQTIRVSDMLTNGSINLNSYSWHQGGSINVSIGISSLFTNTSDKITITLTVS